MVRSADLGGMAIGVLGCGIGGLAAATMLARRGASVTLHERFETPRPVGAGFLLQPTGMAVLAALGVFEPVSRAGARIDALTGYDWRGAKVLDLAYRDLDPRLHGLGVRRSVVFEALLGAAQEAGVRFQFGVEADGVEQTASEARLLFSDGASESFDLIVGADGARSNLRRALGLARRDAPYAWACVWRVAADPGGLLDGDHGRTLDQRYEGARRMAGILPVGQESDDGPPGAALFWSLKAQDHQSFVSAGREEWLRELRAFWPRFADFIAEEAPWEEPTLALYRDVTVSRPYKGRVVLIGDAAHAMSPQLGQGANLALLDAFALDQSIGAQGPVKGAEAYAQARRAQTGWYQLASRWLTPVFQSSNPVWGWGRDLLFPPLCRIGLTRREMLAGQAGMKTGFLSIDRRDWTPGSPPPPVVAGLTASRDCGDGQDAPLHRP